MATTAPTTQSTPNSTGTTTGSTPSTLVASTGSGGSPVQSMSAARSAFSQFEGSYDYTNALGSEIDALNNEIANYKESTQTSMVDVFNQEAAALGQPQLEAQIVDNNALIRGSEQEIIDEVQKSGGIITEAGVKGMVAMRNKNLILQGQYLAEQESNTTAKLNEFMSLTNMDRSAAETRFSNVTSLSAQIAGVKTSLHTAAYNNLMDIVGQYGYDGLAKSIGNPSDMRTAESVLGLPMGFLDNPPPTQAEQRLAIAQGNYATNVELKNILKLQRSANFAKTIMAPVLNSPEWKNFTNAQSYMPKIQAAEKTGPGGVSDFELLDTYVKVSNGGGQITEGQVNTLLGAFGLPTAVINAVAKNTNISGQILTPAIRKQIIDQTKNTYANFQAQAQGAVAPYKDQLQSAGINPDLTQLPGVLNMSNQADNTPTTISAGGKTFDVGQPYQDSSGNIWTVDASGNWTPSNQ